MGIYTKEEQFKLIEDNWRNLEDIDNQYEDVCIEAVKSNGLALQYVKEQTNKICIEAVRNSGLILGFVKKQTPEICLQSIRKNPEALGCVKEQTEELCLEAVRKSGFTLRFAKVQTPKVCIEAFKNIDVDVDTLLKYIKEPSEDIYIGIIKQYPYVIKKVKNKTPMLCFYAFLRDYSLLNLKYIKNGIEKYIKDENTIENSVFCIDNYVWNGKVNNDYNYFDIMSLIYIKDFLIKGSNNIYIFDDLYSDKYLKLIKEIALSNNELIIVDTGNVKDIHRVLANRIIKEEDLYKESF